jgi:hypothetical protein
MRPARTARALDVLNSRPSQIAIQRGSAKAAASKIEVGFSHPSFDLWLLLHFQPFSGAQSGSSKIVIEKLRSAPGADAFKNYDKRNDKSVKGLRRDALRGREKAAATNAKALVATCEHGDSRQAGLKSSRSNVTPQPRPHLNGQRDPGTRRTASLWAVTRLLTSGVSWPRWASFHTRTDFVRVDRVRHAARCGRAGGIQRGVFELSP